MNGLLHDFRDDWQIQQEPGGLFVAVERPQIPVLTVHVADSAAELRELLEADPRRGGDE